MKTVQAEMIKASINSGKAKPTLTDKTRTVIGKIKIFGNVVIPPETLSLLIAAPFVPKAIIIKTRVNNKK